VQVRYRYRLYPTPGQQEALARAFGCARVVYNDCLRLRDACHASGEKISDTEVQRRVITLAKQAPERAWLGEVASVALVQACQDARRAYRNWFGSLAGKRKGRKLGHPVFRRKHGRQSIRLTRSGFAVHGLRLYVAKVGDITVQWSRDLPSVPSSVTVIREPDGRYYASFVVQREPTPLPVCDREIGVDVGLSHLAVTSDGEVIGNPRFMRAKERKLARAQRALSRKQKGSANRAKARQRVAVVHRKVRESRLDHAHKTALRLIRDNQAVYAEDLCVSGLARTKLARSVHDAGWSQLVRLVGERLFSTVGRSPGSAGSSPPARCARRAGSRTGPSRSMSASGRARRAGRSTTGTLTQLRTSWPPGRADKSNACGGSVRPGLALAVPGEAGTHRSAT
jgi:putative transposase